MAPVPSTRIRTIDNPAVHRVSQDQFIFAHPDLANELETMPPQAWISAAHLVAMCEHDAVIRMLPVGARKDRLENSEPERYLVLAEIFNQLRLDSAVSPYGTGRRPSTSCRGLPLPLKTFMSSIRRRARLPHHAMPPCRLPLVPTELRAPNTPTTIVPPRLVSSAPWWGSTRIFSSVSSFSPSKQILAPGSKRSTRPTRTTPTAPSVVRAKPSIPPAGRSRPSKPWPTNLLRPIPLPLTLSPSRPLPSPSHPLPHPLRPLPRPSLRSRSPAHPLQSRPRVTAPSILKMSCPTRTQSCSTRTWSTPPMPAPALRRPLRS
ncbi:hypothetical protein BJ912DRAFT_955044, partial [Pholiota molesta]